MTAAQLVVVLVVLAGFAVFAWLLTRRQKDVPLHRAPRGLTSASMTNDVIETHRFKPAVHLDTVYIPRVGAGLNKHYVDETAEMPAIRPQQAYGTQTAYGRRHG